MKRLIRKSTSEKGIWSINLTYTPDTFTKGHFDFMWSKGWILTDVKGTDERTRDMIWERMQSRLNEIKTTGNSICQQFTGSGFNNIFIAVVGDGTYTIAVLPSEKTFYVNPVSFNILNENSFKEGLIHEIGHMIDRTYGASNSDNFKKLMEMIQFNPRKAYRSQYERSKRQGEAFADLFVSWYFGDQIGMRYKNVKKVLRNNDGKNLVNEYFTSLVDNTPFAYEEYGENGNELYPDPDYNNGYSEIDEDDYEDNDRYYDDY